MKNMHHSEIVLYLVALFHLLMGVLLFFVNVDYFHEYYVKEDGILKWLGFDALLFTSILSFYRLRLWRKRPLTFSVGVCLTGLLFAWGAGEEISYGQRLFKISPPAFWQQAYEQGKLHHHHPSFKAAAQNSQKGDIRKVVLKVGLGLLAALYLVGTPFLYRHRRRAKELADRWGIPIPEPFHALFFLLLFLLTLVIHDPRKGELLEFGGSWICFLLVLYPQNEDIFANEPKLQN